MASAERGNPNVDAVDRCVPRREGHVIQEVRGVHT